MSARSLSVAASRPSMVDVGKLAGVSAQTVSRFYTGKGYVSEDTRARIQAAVDQLSYRPNHVARAFRSSRTKAIGVLTMGAMNYGVSALYAGLTAAARASEYAIILSHIQSDLDQPGALEEARTAVRNLESLQVDGIVLATQFSDSELLLDGLGERLPVVTLSGLPLPTADTYALNSYRAALLATSHLIELGHTRILHVGGPGGRSETSERARGYLKAMAEAGLDPLPIFEGRGWNADNGFAAGTEVDPASFTAVFAANDSIALGFMSAMRSRSLEAPHDYSIVGIDDMPEVAYYAPPLTTARMDFDELGRVAFEMVVHRIQTGERHEPQVIDTVLVVRDSTAPLVRE